MDVIFYDICARVWLHMGTCIRTPLLALCFQSAQDTLTQMVIVKPCRPEHETIFAIDLPYYSLLVGGLEHISHILEISIPMDFHIFQRVWNTQPDYNLQLLMFDWWNPLRPPFNHHIPSKLPHVRTFIEPYRVTLP